MNNKPNPDDRRDNVEKIQYNIDMIIENTERANEMIAETSDEKTIQALTEKNERREAALQSLRDEIRDEALDKENGYKQ
jgi:small acid-soluble spore protein (thioredoxin-like protein)